MGKVFLVGDGPGDPKLLTIKGLKAIKEADVILYDRLVNKDILSCASTSTKFFYCGKDPNSHSLPQEATNKMMVTLARKGHTVTRLKGGDPFVFGRGGEEAEVLASNKIPFEIVPGITSGIAAPAYAGIPVTYRDYSSSVAFVTAVNKPGMDKDRYWEHLANGPETLCVYMGVKPLPEICELLMHHGRSEVTPVALVHMGTSQQQITVVGTLNSILDKKHHIKNPAMIVIGEVVKMRENINWFTEQTIESEVTLTQITST